MKKFVYLNCCMRGNLSRTKRIADPIIEELRKVGEVKQIDVCDLDLLLYNSKEFEKKANGYVPQEYVEWSKEIANCDGLFIGTPLWDMAFPAQLKVFLEDISLFEIMFTQTENAFKGLANCPFIFYIATSGMKMNIGDGLESGSVYLKALSKLWGIKDFYSIFGSNFDFMSEEDILQKTNELVLEGKKLLKNILK